MKIVISGYYGYGNAGDEAILAGMLKTLRAVGPRLEVTVISGEPKQTARDHAVEAIPRARPGPLISALRASDGLISGGGGLLQDRTSARPVAYYAGVTQLARLLGRPYVVYAQGVGPLRRAPNRRLAGVMLSGAAYCSLRDEASITFARAIGTRRSIDLAADPALALQSHASRAGSPYLVVAVRNWPTRVDYIAAIRAALEELAGELSIVALPMQGGADLGVSRAVVSGIRGATVAAPTTTLTEHLAILGGASLVIGMRLHALILAAGAGVPAIAVSYDPKVDAFAGQVGQPILGHVARPLIPTTIVELAHAELGRDLRPYRDRVAELRSRLRRVAVASLAALTNGHP